VKPSLIGGVTAVVLLIAAIVAYSTFFTVYQTNQALVVRLGQPVRVITEPGLNVKMPFVDSVIYIDKRILSIETQASGVSLQSQDQSSASRVVGQQIDVDAFARYRITDPLKYYQRTGLEGADSQLSSFLTSALRRVLGRATLGDVVRNKRDELMAQMRAELDADAKPFGVDVIDVRLRRADLPKENREAVYARMKTERQREAAELRAEGAQKATEIRAKADRDVTVIVADASSQGQTIRGQGDANANKIFADAYSKDPGFFAFYRSMQAYQNSMQQNNTRLVLRPDTDFFRFFGNPSGKTLPDGTPVAVPSAAPGPGASAAARPNAAAK
jgi:membrane protease subunit HflC